MWGFVPTLDQSEACFQVTLSLSTNQRPVSSIFSSDDMVGAVICYLSFLDLYHCLALVTTSMFWIRQEPELGVRVSGGREEVTKHIFVDKRLMYFNANVKTKLQLQFYKGFCG